MTNYEIVAATFFATMCGSLTVLSLLEPQPFGVLSAGGISALISSVVAVAVWRLVRRR